LGQVVSSKGYLGTAEYNLAGGMVFPEVGKAGLCFIFIPDIGSQSEKIRFFNINHPNRFGHGIGGLGFVDGMKAHFEAGEWGFFELGLN